MTQHSSAHLFWFLAGLGVGVAFGIVTAPKPGAQTRRDLGEYINAHRHDCYDRGRVLYQRGRHMAEEAADLFDEGRRLMETADTQAETARA